MKTIKIAGAGLSGLTAGINLAKEGYNVEIFEAKDSVGKRFSGDLQGLENWTDNQDILELMKSYNLDIDFEHTPANNRVEIWTKDEVFHFGKKDFNKPVYYTVRRGQFEGTLDNSLLKQALEYKNISIKFNSPATDLKDFDIIASGPYAKDTAYDYIALGYVFDANITDQSLLILDDKVAPDGYGYFLSMNGHCAIAVCILKDFPNGHSYRDSIYAKIVKDKNIQNIKNLRPYSGMGNFFFMEKYPNKIYCGEAGGFQDMVMGFGMKYAIQTGYYAARSIIDNQNYYSLIDKYIRPKQEASIASRFIYKFFTGSSYTYLVRFMKKIIGTNNALSFAYENNFLHKLFLPIAKYYYKNNIRNPRNLQEES
jgi:flavin-dependent dehydrogenase